jgi:hypothetical protein
MAKKRTELSVLINIRSLPSLGSKSGTSANRYTVDREISHKYETTRLYHN